MTRASEGGHWYKPDGTPVYEVPAKDGTMRPATLRDARKLGLFPGVTTIIRCAAAPGLERWKQDQGILSALTLPRVDGESNDALLARIRSDAEEQARKARERGTEIHAAIQGHFEGKAPSEEMWPFVKGVVASVEANFGIRNWIPEKPCAYKQGYGTKADLICHDAILDFKGADFDEADAAELKTWDEHHMQLAATQVALDGYDKADCAIVYVSRTVPGLTRVIRVEEADLERGWHMFTALLFYWQAKNKYWPGGKLQVAA
jgi:hypothetical protein